MMHRFSVTLSPSIRPGIVSIPDDHLPPGPLGFTLVTSNSSASGPGASLPACPRAAGPAAVSDA
jgi:hypothetical protein